MIKKIFSLDFYKSLLLKKAVKDFFGVVGLNLALKPIVLLKSFMVAKYLGPSDYGILKSLELITLLNKYGNLGFNGAATREVGDAIGAKDLKRAELIKKTAYPSEIIFATILFIIGLLSSLWVENQMISILIILASISLLGAKIRGVLSTEAAINKKFILISKITFISSLIGSIIVIITVPYFKIYAVMGTNILISVIAIIIFIRQLNFRFSFKIDKNELKRILGISIPLTFNTLAQGSFKYAERILILSFLGTGSLGFFSFGSMIVSQFSIILKTGVRVRMQDIYEGLGNSQYVRIHKMVVKETFIFFIISVLIIPIGWFLLGLLVPLFLSKWTSGIPYAQLLLLMLPFQIILLYPGVVLTSSLVNKQNVLPVYRVATVGIFILGTLYLYYMKKLSLEYLIVLNIISQALYDFAILFLYKKYFINKYIKKSVKV